MALELQGFFDPLHPGLECFQCLVFMRFSGLGRRARIRHGGRFWILVFVDDGGERVGLKKMMVEVGLRTVSPIYAGR